VGESSGIRTLKPVNAAEGAELLRFHAVLDDAERVFNARSAELVVDAVMAGGPRCQVVTRNMLREAAYQRARGAAVFAAIRAELVAGTFLATHEMPPHPPRRATP